MVNIVKTKDAEFPEGSLSGDERTEIMLKTIMEDLNQLKQVRRLKNNELEYQGNKVSDIVLSVLRLDSEVEEALRNKSSEAKFKNITLKILNCINTLEKLDINSDVRLKLINTLDSNLEQIKVYKEKNFDL